MPDQDIRSVVTRHAGRAVVVIRVAVLTTVLAIAFLGLADWVNWNVFALAE